jgi:kynurenine 3-monooxygenase
MPGRLLHHEDGTRQFLPYGQNEREVVYAASREQLNRTLIEEAGECPRIELQFSTRCLDVDPEAGRLRLRHEASGQESETAFEVLLGADGAGSAVRGALSTRGLLQVRESPLDHDYKELSLPGAGFESRALHIWPRGGYMLIALPNTDGSFTATLFLPRHGAPSFAGLDSDTAVRHLFEREFADAAVAIADLTQQFSTHPQSHLGTLHCEPWHVGGRVLLLGDAAHAIVPFHGQGLNCGFEDCVLLDRMLAQAPSVTAAGAGLASLLQEFETVRRPDTAAIATMALENYEEMRDTVRSSAFARRQALAAELERRFPDRFIPRYSMVMFHPEIRYAEAQRRGLAQQRILDALDAEPERSDLEALLSQGGL